MESRLDYYQPFQAYIDKKECLSWCVDVAPCEAACPLGIDIEGYLAAISHGDFEQAISIVREKCPLPNVCGRVCHHPCEAECKRGKIDQPLAIMSLKRFAADTEYDKTREEAKEPGEKTVAIIGSGPAGLTAAYDLVKQGHGVTIYEALPVAGGMLAVGIAEFILPHKILQADIDYIKALGVEIKTSTQVGRDLSLSDIWNQGFRVILIATGAQQSAQLPIPGVELDGVMYALPLLREIKLGQKPPLLGKVVVIGGGNVAIDAARTALRLGAAEVHMFCLESREGMPAFEWEVESAEAEGVIIHPSQAPQRLRSTDGKKVSHVDFSAVALFERESSGRIRWTLAEGVDSGSSVETDRVIIAIGQAVDLSAMGDFGLNLSPRKAIVVDEDAMATNVPGIFAAGDVVDVAGTVTGAMAAGRRAAVAIDNYLEGKELRGGLPPTTRPQTTGATIIPRGVPFEEHQKMPELPPEVRAKNFEEVELGFTPEQAVQEAKRCLACRTCHQCIREWDCPAILWLKHGEKISPCIDSVMCMGCGVCIKECPFDKIDAIDLLD